MFWFLGCRVCWSVLLSLVFAYAFCVCYRFRAVAAHFCQQTRGTELLHTTFCMLNPPKMEIKSWKKWNESGTRSEYANRGQYFMARENQIPCTQRRGHSTKQNGKAENKGNPEANITKQNLPARISWLLFFTCFIVTDGWFLAKCATILQILHVFFVRILSPKHTPMGVWESVQTYAHLRRTNTRGNTQTTLTTRSRGVRQSTRKTPAPTMTDIRSKQFAFISKINEWCDFCTLNMHTFTGVEGGRNDGSPLRCKRNVLLSAVLLHEFERNWRNGTLGRVKLK